MLLLCCQHSMDGRYGREAGGRCHGHWCPGQQLRLIPQNPWLQQLRCLKHGLHRLQLLGVKCADLDGGWLQGTCCQLEQGDD